MPLLIGAVAIVVSSVVIGCSGKSQSAASPLTDGAKKPETPQTTSTTSAVSEPAATELAVSGWVIKDLINVRSKPSTTSDVVAQLPRGTEVKLVEYADKWWKVSLSDGRTAYVFENLLSKERYVDPWTRFKFEAGRADPNLNIISGVAGIDGDAPSAAMNVSNEEWTSHTPAERATIAESAFAFWSECLKKCGFDPKTAVVVFRDASGQELGRAKSEGGKPVFVPK